MNMRPVELQFALHKNDEAGHLQNQLNHKPGQDQAQLADAHAKQMEMDRQRTVRADDVLQASVHDREKDAKGRRNGKAGSKKGSGANEAEQQASRHDHPFKGKHIDLSL
ncbi:hypothetical protein [Paenibacillus piri]|uniref:RNA polymerase subunit sigma n=1 Tax=Paenibacillus piri TaxID=2547395 RepID=A0A4R5KR34_9BACL|nr:hypothetical protein [Paenibacillus piri]TDF98201.1 hypothetical protein E1757_11935 [Paenibacillus piri]